jgi:hypothetical protein
MSLCLTMHHAMKMSCLIKHHAMKKYWGVEVQIHAFLTFALDKGEWSASCLDCFTPGMHWIGGWVGPRADLEYQNYNWSTQLTCEV